MKKSDNTYPYLVLSIVLHLSMFCLLFIDIPFFKQKTVIKEDQEQVITFEMLSVRDRSNVKEQQKLIPKEQVKTIKESSTIIEQKPIINNDQDIVDDKEIAKIPNNDESVIAKPTNSTKDNEQKLDKKEIIKEKIDDNIDQLSKLVNEELLAKPKSEAIADNKQKNTKNNVSKSNQALEPKTQFKKNKPSNNNDLNSLLKNLEQTASSKKTKSNSGDTNQQHESKGQFDPTLELSIREQVLIRNQVQKHWYAPSVVQDQEGIQIVVRVKLDQNGEVLEAEVVEKKCSHTSPSICQIMVDRAERAVLQASPITNLNIKSQREFNLNFDSQGMQ
ncbi:MAG: hypothetical protein EOP33_05065 [Rickettsiaceae bacterium]|nr:MAG: hypothetical protein EOP33_05065 [Rickettsiaceae bacterium]